MSRLLRRGKGHVQRVLEACLPKGESRVRKEIAIKAKDQGVGAKDLDLVSKAFWQTASSSGSRSPAGSGAVSATFTAGRRSPTLKASSIWMGPSLPIPRHPLTAWRVFMTDPCLKFLTLQEAAGSCGCH